MPHDDAARVDRKRGHPMNPNSKRRVANIHDAAFRPFVYPDGVALGDSVLQLDDDRPLGEGFHIYRMPAGMKTRTHRHNGHEQFLILEGELIEDDGTVFRPGDMVFYRDGTVHNSHTPHGCLLAVHIAGPEFTVD
jgi:mannose-6-phosphate isomerase-like protein (cupin superfamily)